MRSVKELLELADRAMHNFELGAGLAAIQEATAYTQMAHTQTLAMGSREEFRKELRDALHNATPSYYNRPAESRSLYCSYQKWIDAPFGVTLILATEYSTEERGRTYPSPSPYFAAITPFVAAGWDIQMFRQFLYEEPHSKCDLPHAAFNGQWVQMLGRRFCERCCRPYPSASESEPSHSATEG